MGEYSVTDLPRGAARRLNGFMQEMHNWEVEYYQKSIVAFDSDSSESDLEEEMRNALLTVFRKYVLEGGRNYDRLGSLVCGRYPEYDEESDQLDVIAVSEDGASVIIKKTRGLASVFRLHLSVSNGLFMVSGRDLQNGQKWQRTYV